MLNEPLYRALWLATGSRPKVSRAGQAFTYQVLETQGGRRIRATGGEEYAVNCPHCGDTRARLYVHHRFGLEYPGHEPDLRGPMDSLCFCQNEQKCVPLRKYLGSYESQMAELMLASMPRSSYTSEDSPFSPCPPRGECIPLHELPPDHQAVQYLEGRGYSPHYLSRHYQAGVMVSHPDPKIQGICEGRIVFPFYRDSEEVMWQARLAWDPPKKQRWPPKWWFPPNIQKIPWNLDLARTYDTVVLSEGILSAANMGPAGIAIGGKSLTHMTKRIIAENWKCCVVALDPDAGICRAPDEEDYQARAINELIEAGIPEVYGVQWTAGDLRDPGDLGPRGCYELLARSVPRVLPRLPYFTRSCANP